MMTTTELPPIVGGVCTVGGVVHRMRVAKPSSTTARLYGLNSNHHVRVWCTCMDARRFKRVEVPERQTFNHGISVDEMAAMPAFLDDPRSLGGVDWLGIVDVRTPGSALQVFRRHIQEVCET